MQPIQICLSSDDNYVPYCAVTIASVIQNAKEADVLQFYIFFNGKWDNIQAVLQMQTDRASIEIIQMDADIFKNLPLLSNGHFTSATYFRFKIASILKEIDKVLYLDSDIIVQTSLSELYHMDIGDRHCAACIPNMEASFVRGEMSRLRTENYFSAGIMLINCKKWREDKIEEALFEYALHEKSTKYIQWVDQDVINVVLNKNIEVLEQKWNFHYFIRNYETDNWRKALEQANIIHFAGEKPWNPIRPQELQDFYKRYATFIPGLLRDQIKLYSDYPFSCFFPDKAYNMKICSLTRNFVLYVEKHKELKNKPIAVIVDSECGAENIAGVAARYKDIAYYIFSNEAEQHGSKIHQEVSLHEYIQIAKTESTLLILVSNFDKKTRQLLKRNGLKRKRDYFLESDAAWIIGSMRMKELLLAGKSLSNRMQLIKTVIKYFGFAVYKILLIKF